MTESKAFYRRNLPHWQPKNRPIFVTFRLAGSLPPEVISLMKSRALFDESEIGRQDVAKSVGKQTSLKQSWFRIAEKWLDTCAIGPTWLQDPGIAKLICDVLHFADQKDYGLLCYCVMPNHVHTVIERISEEKSLALIMHRIKGFTASRANRLLGRKGPFWQGESFDHVVRSQSALFKTVRYVLENPIKAGLVQRWQDWPHSYVNNGLKKQMGI